MEPDEDAHVEELQTSVTQVYDYFLVLDVEGTCEEGTSFDYPNEIIEWPVCLLGWKDRENDILEVIDEFKSFVRPTWKPQLSEFCTALTGITQETVDEAPIFTKVMDSMKTFLVSHKLISESGERLVRFCWCTDGPWDICNFVLKQCFISKIQLPAWLGSNVIDIRGVVTGLKTGRRYLPSKRRTLSIPRQLSMLKLAPFEGRQHSGIDDTRNIARIVIELARRNIRLVPNLEIKLKKRWPWMGKSGRILEDKLTFER